MAAAEEGQIDPAVVAALYAEHGEDLRRFLVGLLRDAQLASDVLQATFAKAIQRGHTSREESRRAWLFRVAYHEAMAYRRREALGGRVTRNLAWTTETVGEAADAPLMKEETAGAIRVAIEQLPAEQRLIVRMRMYEEKTFAVIAKELGIPLGTALARMRAALSKLRKALVGEENEDS